MKTETDLRFHHIIVIRLISGCLSLYTTEKLDKAKHVHEIPYDNSITTVNIDHLLCGVGGDLPGQAFVREPYLMKKKV